MILFYSGAISSNGWERLLFIAPGDALGSLWLWVSNPGFICAKYVPNLGVVSPAPTPLHFLDHSLFNIYREEEEIVLPWQTQHHLENLLKHNFHIPHTHKKKLPPKFQNARSRSRTCILLMILRIDSLVVT